MDFAMFRFEATLEIIGINPFVFVPSKILEEIFRLAGKDRSPIPVRGTVNGNPYLQTLVKYGGAWRLYINTSMLAKSPQRIGETLLLTVTYDPSDRSIPIPVALKEALEANPAAAAVFNAIIPSRRLEIVRYIAHLKSEESIRKNVRKAVEFLLGNGRFAGRDKP